MRIHEWTLKTSYDVTTEEIIDCDVAVRIDGKGDGAAADQMARWAVSLLRQAGADFAVLTGADRSTPSGGSDSPVHLTVRYAIIHSEAVPGMPGGEDEFARVIEVMERHFKKALPHSDGISVLPMGEYIPLFYSVNETSGLANVPGRVDKLDAGQEFGVLNDVQVTQDWWDIPGEVSAEVEELFRKVAGP